MPRKNSSVQMHHFAGNVRRGTHRTSTQRLERECCLRKNKRFGLDSEIMNLCGRGKKFKQSSKHRNVQILSVLHNRRGVS